MEKKTIVEFYLELTNTMPVPTISKIISELIGKYVIVPDLYDDMNYSYYPKRNKIVDMHYNPFSNSPFPFQLSLKENMMVIYKDGVKGMKLDFNGADKDYCINTFLIGEEEKKEFNLPLTTIAKYNSLISATHCINCNNPLTPIFGSMMICKQCEK